MKIITVCGSLKFKSEILAVSEKMALQGNCMLTMVFPSDDGMVYTDEEKELLGMEHKERIRIADAILVMDVNPYIGESTRNEIAYAKALEKEILYYSDLLKRHSI